MRTEKRDKTRDEPVSIDPSSGNVFADLGLENAEELLAKAKLVQHFVDITAERKLTQVRAAKLLGIDQPNVSALPRGKLDGFSTDRLFRFLNALGRDVEIAIRPAKASHEAETRVLRPSSVSKSMGWPVSPSWRFTGPESRARF
jgi:predicted XRE-type DNA-binding protein